MQSVSRNIHIYAHTICHMLSFPEAPGFVFWRGGFTTERDSAEQENHYFDWNLWFHACQQFPLCRCESPGPQWSVSVNTVQLWPFPRTAVHTIPHAGQAVWSIRVIVVIKWSMPVCLGLAIVIISAQRSSLGNIRVLTGFLLQLICITINAEILQWVFDSPIRQAVSSFHYLRSFLLSFPFGFLSIF